MNIQHWIDKTIKPLFILDKTKRKEYRNSYKNRPIEKNAMKIGVSYSVWDGEELLEYSIRSIRQNVDYINVVWQRLSWHGKECDSNLPALLEKLKSKGLIDEVIKWEPDLNKIPHHNEINKRNVGLEHAKKAGCNYFRTMDTDEFFKKDEFEKAKELVYRNGITRSFVGFKNYTQKPQYMELVQGPDYVPFLYKIDSSSKLDNARSTNVPLMIDGTKKMKISASDKVWVFGGDFCMHHMSSVRKDIAKKIANSSGITEQNKNDLQNIAKNAHVLTDENLYEKGYIKVKNHFGIEF